MIIHTDKKPQRHVIFGRFVCGVKCDAVTEICVCSLAASIGPEYISDNFLTIVINSNICIREEVLILILHLLKECKQFLHVILRISPRKFCFAAKMIKLFSLIPMRQVHHDCIDKCKE